MGLWSDLLDRARMLAWLAHSFNQPECPQVREPDAATL
jgi:hypothetical protein